MTNFRGRAVASRGRGRASASTSSSGGWESESPNVIGRGRGGTFSPLQGGSSDHGGGRGLVVRGGPSRGHGRTSIFMPDHRADIDPRIADNSDKVLVASYNQEGVLPFRPDFGTNGREIKLRTNFFPLQVLQGTKFYAYNVAISPPHIPFRMKKRIYHLGEQTAAWAQAGMSNFNVAHDSNTNLISVRLLPQPLTIMVPYYNEDKYGPPHQDGKVYVLTIKFVGEINTGTLASYLTGQMEYRDYDTSPVFSALNVILMSFPRNMGITILRNRYFLRLVAEPFRLGGGVESWKGIYTSLQPTYKQLMINVNVCTMPFYTPGNLVHAMQAFQGVPLISMNRFFLGVHIEAIHLGHRKVIRKLVSLTAKTCSFDTIEYGHVSVEDYFRQKYNIHLQYPDLQLVEIGVQTRGYLPAELCYVLPGQPNRRRLTEEQTAIMSTVTRQPANKHGETTVHQLHYQLGLDVIRPELETFGITISSEMAVVPGRILPKPGIMYASSAIASIGDRASWNLIGVKFAVGARLDNWAVLVIKDGFPSVKFNGASDGDLREAVSAFRHMCNASGMHVIADPTYTTAQLPRKSFDPIRQEAIQTIKNTLLNVKPKPALVLVMLANKDGAIYEGVKHLCDVRLDVATVCVQSSKIRKRNPHYLANMVLKANMKLGGLNHRLGGDSGEWLKSVPTMVIGMNVTHPNSGSCVGCPSIAAVVASVDRDFAQYPTILEIQGSRNEMITNLTNMMVDRLRLFQKKNNGKLPERILIYRSGISKSHFNILRQVEQPLIIEAFKAFSYNAPYRPKFTIVVCNKSRRVQFYPTEPENATMDGYPLPGTVVDRGITAIYDFDFYLQSHGSGPQSIAHPTHYYVIHDEIGFKADEIQGVTNALSYMFARSTQAVSVVSPVYYADAACQRGRCYLRKLFHGYDGEATASGAQTKGEGATELDVVQEARRLWGWGVAGAALKDTMFYL